MNLFSLPFMRYALSASLMAGTALALLGIFILARRISFSGLAVSQLAALGTVAGAYLGLHYGEFGFALTFVGFGMLILSLISKNPKVPQESWVACLYILGAGLSVLLLSKSPQGESHTLNIFFGNILALSVWEVWESLGLLLLTGLALWLWFYRWIWISFDPLSAEVSKIKADRWNFVFFLLFALGMTISIHIFGVLLAFAYLLLPAAVAFLLVRSLKALFILVPILTVAATLLGFYLSFRLDFPTGPFIASTMAGTALAAGIYYSWKS